MSQSVREQTLELVDESWAEGLTCDAEEIAINLEDIAYNMEEGHITEALADAIKNIAANDARNTARYRQVIEAIHAKRPEIAVAVLLRLDELAMGKPSYGIISQLRTELRLPRATVPGTQTRQ